MKKILLIDDDEDYASVVRMRLEKEGYEVACAHGCEQAIAILNKDFSYDLVILVIEMPEKNGLATLSHLRNYFKRVKRMERFPIPVMMATGLQSERLESIFSSQDVAGYIKKPFESKVLIGKIKEILEAKA